MTSSGDRSLVAAVVGDGRPLLLAVAGALAFSGGFAIFLAASGQFLPHDIAFLGRDAAELCAVADCRIVDFMVHDRVAWGATLLAIAVLQTWVVLFPLARGAAWAWWLLTVGGVVGFATFLAYLGYGYLDSWHGLGTLLLLPVWVAGTWRTRPRRQDLGLPSGRPMWLEDRAQVRARGLVLLAAIGLVGAGTTILGIGVTSVFVPSDLAFIGLDADGVRVVDPRLVPLIAHDRAGFGGGVVTGGLMIAGIAWWGDRGRALWQALAVAGVIAFGATLWVHLAVGYTDLLHLAPAVAGAIALLGGTAVGSRSDRVERVVDVSVAT